MTTQGAALSYAARGWLVFPLWWMKNDGTCACGVADCGSPGKHPIGKLAPAGRNNATVDEKKIVAWWKKYPQANVGIATGEESNLLVIDVDPGHGGEKSLKQMPGNMPLTTKARTGGKGWHWYFKYPAGSGITIGTMMGGFEGVDWRGNGGYVVAPPSNHASGGPYSWEIKPDSTATPLAPAPAWILELLTTKEVPIQTGGTVKISSEDLLPPEEKWATDLLREGVGEGSRDDTCARLAGRYLGMGMSEDEVGSLLLAWNLRNSPALPDKDIIKVVRSIARKEGRKRVAQSVPAAGPEPEEEIPADLPEDEKRTIIIESLGKRLGIPLESIARMGGDSVKYIFQVNENGASHEVWMSVPELTSLNSFKNKIATLCRRMIPAIKAGPWAILVQRMMDAAIDIEPGPEATMSGMIGELLQIYVEAEDKIQAPDQMGGQLPFKINNRINIFLTAFSGWLKLNHNVLLTNQELAQRMKALGAARKNEWINGKTRRFWELPEGFTSQNVFSVETLSAIEESSVYH